MRSFRFACAAAAVAYLASGPNSWAANVTINAPTKERWMYPFGSSTSDRPNPSTFGTADGDATFDERDAQFLLGFDLSAAGIPTGLGATSYQINSVVLEMTIQGAPDDEGDPTLPSFAYDPTYDGYETYTTEPDTDTGRPVELYGIGFRNGYTQLTLTGPNNTVPNWSFKTAFQPPGPPGGAGMRSAYALGSNGTSLVDVSNNLGANGVTSGFEVLPMAVGQISGLAPGTLVADGTKMTFSLVSDPDYLAYIQNALNVGALGLALSSIHEAAQGAPPTYPLYDSLFSPGGVPAKLTIDYTIVPEPSSWALAACGLATLAACARRRRWSSKQHAAEQ